MVRSGTGDLEFIFRREHIGTATARVLTGQVNPSGKLAETYPKRYQDVVSAEIYDKHTRAVPYVESSYIGYRYFDKAKVPVAFPFGFGLSYTTFAIKHVRLVNDEVTDAQPVTVQLDVTNTGDMDGQSDSGLRQRTAAASITAGKSAKGIQESLY